VAGGVTAPVILARIGPVEFGELAGPVAVRGPAALAPAGGCMARGR
jgi:hypothetical protein